MQVTGLVVAVLACAVTSWAADPDWWKRAVVYQVYPRSLKDNDGNGIGDLDGKFASKHIPDKTISNRNSERSFISYSNYSLHYNNILYVC